MSRLRRTARAPAWLTRILAARGLRRRIAPGPAELGRASLRRCRHRPDRDAAEPIVTDLAGMPGLLVVPAPLPPVEVSPHLFWHPRTQNSPWRAWLRAVIKETAAAL